LDYLARHPAAEDTIDGILHWWLLEACLRKWTATIAETVANLVAQGFLEERTSAEGRIFYRLARNHPTPPAAR
jgi:hypothetical protein